MNRLMNCAIGSGTRIVSVKGATALTTDAFLKQEI
jgi:hypothetical protein